MKRIIPLTFLALILAACSKPVTATPTIPPTTVVTVAPPTLSAPVVSAPAFTVLQMIDARNG